MADLSNLPKPQVIEEISADTLLDRKIDKLQSLFDEHGLPYDVSKTAYDPAVIQLEVSAYDETLLRQRINEAARANLLYFASGSDLDHLGDFHGVERIFGESDERYRIRIRLNRRGNSTGGTEPRYRYFALTADLRVKDVVVYRNGRSPLIHVAIFGDQPDGSADPELIAKVTAALNDPTVKMTNDTIEVSSAVRITVNIAADIWLLPDAPLTVIDFAANNLRDQWHNSQALGRDLSLSWITSRLMVDGVHHIVIREPVSDVSVPPFEAAAIGDVKLEFKGRAY